jgi:hypothetical protein
MMVYECVAVGPTGRYATNRFDYVWEFRLRQRWLVTTDDFDGAVDNFN